MKLLIAGLSLLVLAAGLFAFTDLSPATPLIAGIVGTFVGAIHAISPSRSPGRAVAADPNGDAYWLSNIQQQGSPVGVIGGGGDVGGDT